MSARDELRKLLDKAGVKPYRRVGKVRMVYDPRTPPETVQAAAEAVRRFSPSLVDGWGEPEGSRVSEWRTLGLVPMDICDDPAPHGTDPATCPVAWLVERCARYHFALVPVPPPTDLVFRGTDGWDLAKVVPLLPAWFVSACKERRPEIVAHVHATHRETRTASTPAPPGESEDESTGTYCATCAATVYTTSPEVQRMCHMTTCPHWTEASGVGPGWLAKERSAAEWRNRKTG